jgi:hypothetical protein
MTEVRYTDSPRGCWMELGINGTSSQKINVTILFSISDVLRSYLSPSSAYGEIRGQEDGSGKRGFKEQRSQCFAKITARPPRHRSSPTGQDNRCQCGGGQTQSRLRLLVSGVIDTGDTTLRSDEILTNALRDHAGNISNGSGVWPTMEDI